MSTLIGRNANEDTGAVLRIGPEGARPDRLTAGTGTRGVTKDLHPLSRDRLHREVDHERFLLV